MSTPLDGLVGAAGSASAADASDSTVVLDGPDGSDGGDASLDVVDAFAEASADGQDGKVDAPVDVSVEDQGLDAGPEADAVTEPDASIPIEPNEACKSHSAAQCDRWLACAGTFAMEVRYGTVEACKTDLWDLCMARLQAADTGDSPNQEQACATAFSNLSCRDLLAEQLPSVCAPAPGSRQDGEPCWTASQCASAHCSVADRVLCGMCAAPLAEGQMCQHDGQCGWSMHCHFDGRCRSFSKVGEACSTQQPCSIGLPCESGACHSPIDMGKPCDPTLPNGGCDELRGAFCHSVDQKCTQGTTAGVAGQCGLYNQKLIWCSGGGACWNIAGENRCVLPGVGSKCAVDGGAAYPCEAPARCRNDVCTLPNVVACP